MCAKIAFFKIRSKFFLKRFRSFLKSAWNSVTSSFCHALLSVLIARCLPLFCPDSLQIETKVRYMIHNFLFLCVWWTVFSHTFTYLGFQKSAVCTAVPGIPQRRKSGVFAWWSLGCDARKPCSVCKEALFAVVGSLLFLFAGAWNWRKTIAFAWKQALFATPAEPFPHTGNCTLTVLGVAMCYAPKPLLLHASFSHKSAHGMLRTENR